MDTHQTNTTEERNKKELLFALKNRKRTAMIFISTESYQQQKNLKKWMVDECPEYQFHDIDLTPTNVSSLNYELKRQLPEIIVNSEPVQYVVNVFGLENSLVISEEGKIIPSNLTAQLNFERENLFKVPYVTILWADRDFFVTLQQEAPDFSHWVNYIFHFEDKETKESYDEKTFIPEKIAQKGFIPERSERLEELEEKFEKLPLNSEEKERLIKDKIDLLIAISDEYQAQPNYQKAKEKLKIALSLADKTGMTHLLGKIYFELGNVALGLRDYNGAIDYYYQAKLNLTEINFGVIHHQVGIAFYRQRKWKDALKNYQIAIECLKITKSLFEIGGTYHQIGMVFEEQGNFKKALENYQLAIEWDKKNGNQFNTGSIYHQIGILFYQQRKWREALENYQLAIEWDKKSGNQFNTGSIYHQIGVVYQEQRKWKKALENYQLAIEWKKKTSNQFELGGTYHQIGMVYEEQGDLQKALDYFERAVANLKEHDHPNLPIAEESLTRVQAALEENK